MPRTWLSRKLPSNKQLQEQLGIGNRVEASARGSAVMAWFDRKLTDPLLWHLNRRSVAGAVAVGLFVGWLPIPMQMLVAAFLAAVLRVHVPVSVVLVWFSNPFTFPALLYAAWSIGSTILGTSIVSAPLSISITTLMNEALQAWPTILFGCVFLATATAVAGFFATNMIWRFIAVRRWRQRSR